MRRRRLAAIAATVTLVGLAATTSDAQAGRHDPDVKLSVGGYYANFDNNYGEWAGGHARLWLLDVTGERKWQGFIELVDLHWRPDDPLDIGAGTDSQYLMLRVMHQLNDSVYAFVTLSGSIGDLVYPRIHAETEVNWIVPTHKALSFSFGLGHRNFDEIDRPYILAGVAYSLPMAAISYRLYAGAGMAKSLSYSHLVTINYGARLDFWIRLELLFGEEAHPGGTAPLFLGGDVESRAVTLNWDQWILDFFGVTLRARLSEGRLRLDYGLSDGEVRSTRDEVYSYWQLEVRPFITF